MGLRRERIQGNRDLEDEFHGHFHTLAFFAPLLVYYLSEVFKACLESILVKTTFSQQRS